LSFKKTEIRTI